MRALFSAGLGSSRPDSYKRAASPSELTQKNNEPSLFLTSSSSSNPTRTPNHTQALTRHFRLSLPPDEVKLSAVF